MKALTDTIHRTPWWALFGGGLLVLLALAAFVTPYHIIDYRKERATPEQRRAIKREIDNAFADNAIDIARGVLSTMRNNAADPSRRDELDQALQSLDEARVELREAGAEVLRAKREAIQDARQAVKDATEAIRQAQKDADAALAQAGAQGEAVRKSLEESLAAARRAQEEARVAADAAARNAQERQGQARILEERGKRRIVIGAAGQKPMIDIELDDDGAANAPSVTVPPTASLPPELRSEIRRNVTHDIYRIGVGAGLILLFIPIFIVTIVSKFFIDRSRAALRMADLQRKEAEYHRMSQQVSQARLSALQAQVEPHFLYNTLASVQALTEVDPQKANDMTGHLIHYLRNALPKMRESVSTVGQEVELVRAYLSILQMRMGKRLAFTIDVPAELNELPFPPLMLPSLVENAIKHGLEPQREGGEVRIRAESSGGRLRMIVADTGKGFAQTPGAGVGLANIRERLTTMYGDDASLALEANEPRGVVATIEVPRTPARVGAAMAEGSRPDPSMSDVTVAPTRTRRVLSAMGTAERAWRKSLSFAFVVLVAVAAVIAGLGIVGLMTGTIPAHFGANAVPGPMGALLGTAGIAIAFAAVVITIAVLLAVIYGLGYVFLALLIFVPLVILVALFPVLSPLILLGLGIWWYVRRRKRKEAEATAARGEPAASRTGPAVADAPPAPPAP